LCVNHLKMCSIEYCELYPAFVALRAGRHKTKGIKSVLIQK
jgi:hypothetical protein